MTPSLRDAVLFEISTHRSRTRSEGRRRAAWLYGLAVLAGLPLFFAWGGFKHVMGRPTDVTLGIALGALLITVACADAAWWRGNGSAVGKPTSLLIAVAILAPVATYTWLVIWHDCYDDLPPRIGFRCLAMTLVAGGSTLAAALHVRRGTALVNPTATGAGLGAAAGALAQVIVDMWCPLTNAAHVLVGHALPVALLTAVGAAIGRRVLPLHAQTPRLRMRRVALLRGIR